jgi:putative aldouronate transport system substrate-binding protein
MMLVTTAQMKELAESGMIADLTPHWESYSTDMMKQFYTQQGPAVLNAVRVDGRIMGLGAPDVFGDGVFLWIRADWLKKLGLRPPRTMQELIAICGAFTERDPDGNGVRDTYGIVFTKSLYGGAMGLEGFFAGYHAYPNMWIDDGTGKLIWGSLGPQVKEGLRALAEMYRAGQIDREFGVKDGGKAAETIASGKAGVEFGAQWNPMYPLISSYNNDPNADWTGYGLVSADNKPVFSPQNFGGGEATVVRGGFPYPEALIKMASLYMELIHGAGGNFDYYYMPKANNGLGVWKFSPITPEPPFKNLTAFMALQNARQNNTLELLTGEAQSIHQNIVNFAKGDKSQWGWDKIYGTEGVFRHGVEYLNENRFLFASYTAAPTPAMIARMESLRALEIEVFSKIIMGSSPLSDFDKFVNDWNRLGGEVMTREANAWYASIK